MEVEYLKLVMQATRRRTLGQCAACGQPCERGPSGEPALRRPSCELVPRRQLELSKHRRHVTLHRLRGDEELAGDFLVCEAARDQAQHLSLAWRELIKLRIEGRYLPARVRELRKSVEHESREPRREHRLAVSHP